MDGAVVSPPPPPGGGEAPRLLVVEHEEDAPVALFGTWLGEAGVRLDVVRPWKGEPLPTDPSHDGLVVLGGAMGAEEDGVAPWLPGVRELLRRAVEERLPTFGICLGAQLLAVACGGRVEVGEAGPELGVCSLELTAEAPSDRLFAPLPSRLLGAQWHLDAITTLPEDAVLLASSDLYEVEAFRLGEHAWGVQCHPEVDAEVVAGWVAAEHSETFSPERLAEVVEDVRRAEAALAETWRGVAERFAALVREGSPRPEASRA